MEKQQKRLINIHEFSTRNNPKSASLTPRRPATLTDHHHLQDDTNPLHRHKHTVGKDVERFMAGKQLRSRIVRWSVVHFVNWLGSTVIPCVTQFNKQNGLYRGKMSQRNGVFGVKIHSTPWRHQNVAKILRNLVIFIVLCADGLDDLLDIWPKDLISKIVPVPRDFWQIPWDSSATEVGEDTCVMFGRNFAYLLGF